MSEVVERIAVAMYRANPEHKRKPFHEAERWLQNQARDMARAAIMELWNPDETMWGGLARDLVMWDRGMPNQYGSTLYQHLRSSGRNIPGWLEAEIPDTRHTPPKGTVAVCIFKAMLDDALGSTITSHARGSEAE